VHRLAGVRGSHDGDFTSIEPERGVDACRNRGCRYERLGRRTEVDRNIDVAARVENTSLRIHGTSRNAMSGLDEIAARYFNDDFTGIALC
jgi:hypothetical protein